MNESILQTIKDQLGLPEEETFYDSIIIVDINSAFSILAQLGIGPSNGFAITGNKDVWTDFIPDDRKLSMIRTYIYMKVRLMFDPPTSSMAINAMKDQIAEMEYRMNVIADNGGGHDE